jgi:hypothetical protein
MVLKRLFLLTGSINQGLSMEISVKDFFKKVILIMRFHTSLTQEEVPLRFAGTRITNPGCDGPSPLVFANLAILEARFVLNGDARVTGIFSRFADKLQYQPVLNPIAKVVHIFQRISWT